MSEYFVPQWLLVICRYGVAMPLLYVHRFRFVFIMAILIAMSLSPPLTSLTNPGNETVAYAQIAPVVTRTAAETFYLKAINDLRAKNGQKALVIDARLSLSAAQKTSDMITQNYWGHYAPTGTSFADYVWASSPDAIRSGETLVRCINDRQAAFDALVASHSHFEVMVGNYTNLGVSEMVVPGSDCVLTTTHFSYN